MSVVVFLLSMIVSVLTHPLLQSDAHIFIVSLLMYGVCNVALSYSFSTKKKLKGLY